MYVWLFGKCANVAVDANAAVTHQNVFEQADTPVTFNIRVKAIRDTVTVRILGKGGKQHSVHRIKLAGAIAKLRCVRNTVTIQVTVWQSVAVAVLCIN